MQKRRMLTKNPYLGHYAKDKENLVTTDASKTEVGITLWQKQDNGVFNRSHSVVYTRISPRKINPSLN